MKKILSALAAVLAALSFAALVSAADPMSELAPDPAMKMNSEMKPEVKPEMKQETKKVKGKKSKKMARKSPQRLKSADMPADSVPVK